LRKVAEKANQTMICKPGDARKTGPKEVRVTVRVRVGVRVRPGLLTLTLSPGLRPSSRASM